MKNLTNRTRRVGENIRAVLAKHILLREHFIEDLKDILITVTEVQPSSDLRHAKVYISCLGKEKENVVKVLNQHSNLFSKLVAKEINTKYSPKLIFYSDLSYDKAKKIEDLIKHSK
tara:strand:- start:215 stop:562 length:348 start_codon:yes stop_codon:yes gene_type:complete